MTEEKMEDKTNQNQMDGQNIEKAIMFYNEMCNQFKDKQDNWNLNALFIHLGTDFQKRKVYLKGN